MDITRKEMKVLLKAQQGELDAVLMYEALAKAAKNPADAEVFRVLAKDELRHALVFYRLTKKRLLPKPGKAVLLPALYKSIGKERLYPMIAKREYEAFNTYAPVANRFPSIKRVQKDEAHHGDVIMGMLRGE